MPAAGRLVREWGTCWSLAPGSIWAQTLARYAALAARLADRATVVAVGGRRTSELAAEIVRRRAPRAAAINACGRLALRESAALIGRATVLITNDSAPLHFAAAMGTPIVALFGPTVPGFGFGPRGPRDVVVERLGLPCRPCSAHGPRTCPLGHHRCMREILVEDVMRAIEETGALRRQD
jgi:heptosyltransferase-2